MCGPQEGQGVVSFFRSEAMLIGEFICIEVERRRDRHRLHKRHRSLDTTNVFRSGHDGYRVCNVIVIANLTVTYGDYYISFPANGCIASTGLNKEHSIHSYYVQYCAFQANQRRLLDDNLGVYLAQGLTNST